MANDEQYRKHFEKWVASLPQAEREALRATGCDKPLLDENLSTKDYKIALEKAIAPSISDKSIPHPNDATIQTLAYVLARLQSKSDKHALIDRDALVFALGLNLLEGTSETEISRKYGITKQAFSVRVKRWQKILQLPPSIWMKSNKACAAYRRARVHNLTRNK